MSGTVLVTGGTGFIGRALVAALVESGHSVRLYSRRPIGASAGVTPVLGDLSTGRDLEAAVTGCDTVFHCAAEKRDAERMEAVNVNGTRALFDTSASLGVRRFCHLSSVGVIGLTSSRVVDENTPCRPMNTYEETKLRAEQIVAPGFAGANVVILRPTNVFDTASLTEYADASPAARLKMMLKGREHAHFVYLADVVAAALHATFAASGPPSETFIVSSDLDAGNTHREIQAVVRTARPEAPRATVVLPAFVPYYLRLARSGAANRGDVIYSSKRLLASGFRFPFGLAAGLRHALQS